MSVKILAMSMSQSVVTTIKSAYESIRTIVYRWLESYSNTRGVGATRGERGAGINYNMQFCLGDG